jgi:hypothetical protein
MCSVVTVVLTDFTHDWFGDASECCGALPQFVVYVVVVGFSVQRLHVQERVLELDGRVLFSQG